MKIKALRQLVLVLVVVGLNLGCSAGRKVGTTQVFSQDTTHIDKMIKVKYQPKLNLKIGESISFPDLKMNIIRISENEALVQSQTEVVTQTQNTTEFVGTKTKNVDKSKNDSYNKTKNADNTDIKEKNQENSGNKAKKAENTDVKEKNQENSGNKAKTNEAPWWMFVIAFVAIVVGLIFLYKKLF